jgi:hypothetical protein
MRKRYTYIPNSEIESLTTWNGVEFKGSQLLDGAYAKGNIKYAEGGITKGGHDEKTLRSFVNFINSVNKTKTIEQQAQELIGDEWYSMSDEQRATSITEFITSGVISPKLRYAEGGTIRDEFLYIFEENQPNVDYYEDVDYMTIFSSDKDEIQAIATYLQIPFTKIRFEPNTQTYFIQVDKDGRIMAKGGGVKDAGFVVTFTVAGKKIKKNYSTEEDMDAGIADFYLENLDVENVEIEEKKQEKKKEVPVDVFASAKEEKKKSKKDEYDRVEIEGAEDKISRIREITKSKKSLDAEEKLLKGEIKELAREVYIEKYEKLGRRPDNFRVVEGDENILFIVQDGYIGVSDEKSALLKENYPELLGETVSYKISEAMMKKEGLDGRKIGDIIKDLIGRSRDISDEDKMNLFTITREIAIKEGAIEKLADYDNIEEVYNIIQPIEALK